MQHWRTSAPGGGGSEGSDAAARADSSGRQHVCVLGVRAWGKLTVCAHTHPGPGQAPALDLTQGPFIRRSRAGLDCSIVTKEAFKKFP